MPPSAVCWIWCKVPWAFINSPSPSQPQPARDIHTLQVTLFFGPCLWCGYSPSHHSPIHKTTTSLYSKQKNYSILFWTSCTATALCRSHCSIATAITTMRINITSVLVLLALMGVASAQVRSALVLLLMWCWNVNRNCVVQQLLAPPSCFFYRYVSPVRASSCSWPLQDTHSPAWATKAAERAPTHASALVPAGHTHTQQLPHLPQPDKHHHYQPCDAAATAC